MIPLDEAREAVANAIVKLSPLCKRIAVAGSVRRGRPYVNDIDFVCIPNSLSELMSVIQSHGCSLVRGGDLNLTYRSRHGVMLDFFLAHDGTQDLFAPQPSNWGSVFLCRTGSKAHNIKIVERAKSMGMEWRTYHGLFRDGQCVASESEPGIFRALGMNWIEPKDRE